MPVARKLNDLAASRRYWAKMAASKRKKAKKRKPRASGHSNLRRMLNPPKVKMRKAPKGWIKAKYVRVVRRGGKRIVEVKR
jgi:hypothetical protein